MNTTKLFDDYRAWMTNHDRVMRSVLLLRALVRTLGTLTAFSTRTEEEALLQSCRAAACVGAGLILRTVNSRGVAVARDAIEDALRTSQFAKAEYLQVLSCSRQLLAGHQEEFANLPTFEGSLKYFLAQPRAYRDALEFDANIIEQFAAQRADPAKYPIWFAGPAVDLETIKTNLDARGSNWSVWSRWFGNYYHGAGIAEQDALIFSSAPDDYWARPGRVNGWIANPEPIPADYRSIVNELWVESSAPAPDENAIEPQERTSVNFGITSTGQLEVDKRASADLLQITQLQYDLHRELKSQLNDLCAHCVTNNFLAPLSIGLAKFDEAIGASPVELSPGLAVLRGNALRVDLETDDRRRNSNDPDRPPLPEGIRGALQQVAQGWSIYVGLDPLLDAMDANRLGPDVHRGGLVTSIGITKAIDLAETEALATTDAIESLRQIESMASSATTAAERAWAFQLVALRNFARAALRLAVILGKGGSIVAGGLAAIKWTASNEVFLRDLLQNSPSMLTVLDWILLMAKRIAL